MKDKIKEMENLIKEIDKLNYHYYTLDDPLLSDAEYDKLYDKLVNLEKESGRVLPYSPTTRVGGAVLSKFENILILLGFTQWIRLREMKLFLDGLIE